MRFKDVPLDRVMVESNEIEEVKEDDDLGRMGNMYPDMDAKI